MAVACGGSSNPTPDGSTGGMGGTDGATGGGPTAGTGGGGGSTGGSQSGTGGAGCEEDCPCPEELGCAENAVCDADSTECGCPLGYIGGETLCILDHDVDCKLEGLALGYFMNEGEQPGTKLSRAEAIERVGLIADLTEGVRTYGCEGDREIVKAAKDMGLRVSAAAYMTENDAQNADEIDCLIETCNAGLCDVAIVGNEFELSGASPEQILAGINEVKAAISDDIPVTTAVMMGSYAAEPTLAAAVDELYVHIYPTVVPVGYSISYLHDAYEKERAVAGEKPIVISETGWPSGGNLGRSPWASDTPFTEADAATYLMDFVTWADSELRDQDSYFYFAAMDEPWKEAVEGNWADHWGITTAGAVKDGVAETLACERSNPSWGTARIPDAAAAGDPTLSVTNTPALGTDDPICGTANFLVPSDHHILVYVNTDFGWWGPKSSGGSALVMSDGNWCSYYASTGTADEDGSEIAVFLMEKTFAALPVLGETDLPSELAAAAVDSVIVER